MRSVQLACRELVAALPRPAPDHHPDVIELATLADVRLLVEKHLPKEYRSKFSWRPLAGLLKRAAEEHLKHDPQRLDTSAMSCLEGVKRP
jgi:hypothetical protein